MSDVTFFLPIEADSHIVISRFDNLPFDGRRPNHHKSSEINVSSFGIERRSNSEGTVELYVEFVDTK